MFCPKCGGGTFIAEEDLVKVLENSKPLKAILKIIYVCRACTERFSRLVHEDLETKKRDTSGINASTDFTKYSNQDSSDSDDAAEGLKFF